MTDFQTLINLTPHEVTVRGKVFPPSCEVARVTDSSEIVGEAFGIPVVVKRFDRLIVGLPKKDNKTGYIVSYIVANVAWDQSRTDVFCVGNPVRDENGKIIGAENLCTHPRLSSNYHPSGWFDAHYATEKLIDAGYDIPHAIPTSDGIAKAQERLSDMRFRIETRNITVCDAVDGYEETGSHGYQKDVDFLVPDINGVSILECHSKGRIEKYII